MTSNYVFFYGDRLREARCKKGLTQQEVADKVGASQPEISDYEREIKGCFMGRARKIVDFFKVPYEELVQRAETIKGEVQIPSSPPPRDIAHFKGRTDEINRIKKILRGEGKVGILGMAGIFGMGGIGKTALATHVVADPEIRKQFRDGVIWFEVGEEQDVMIVLDRLGGHLKSPSIGRKETEGDKLSSLLEILSELHALIVYDNVWSDQIAQTLVRHYGTCSVILTGRKTLALGLVEPVPLKGLERDKARELFCLLSELNEAQHGEIVDEICRLVSYHPLAIKILATNPIRKMAPEHLLKRLSTPERLKLLQDTSEDKDNSVRVSFDISFEDLEKKDQRLFAALGTFGRPSFTLEAVEAVMNKTGLEDDLGILINCSIIEREGERYRLHDLMWDYAKEKLLELEDNEELSERMATYFLNVAEEDASILETDKENVFFAMDWYYERKRWESVYRFIYERNNKGTFDFLNFHGYWSEGIKQCEKAIEAANRAGNHMREGAILSYLGIFYQHRGKFNQAEKIYTQSYEIFREQKAKEQIGSLLHQLGRVAQERKDLDKAEESYLKALDSFEALEETLDKKRTIQLRRARTIQQLGRIHELRCNWDKAEERHCESLEIRESIDDPHGKAQCLQQLGKIAKIKGDLEKAKSLMRESLQIKRKIGDIQNAGNSLASLGLIAKDEEHFEDAFSMLYEAKSIFLYLESPKLKNLEEELSDVRSKLSPSVVHKLEQETEAKLKDWPALSTLYDHQK